MRLNRRAVDRGNRMSRVAVTSAIGVPMAALMAWGLKLRGITMEPGIEAAMGAVVGAVVVCFHDVLRYLGAYVAHRLGFPPHSDDS